MQPSAPAVHPYSSAQVNSAFHPLYDGKMSIGFQAMVDVDGLTGQVRWLGLRIGGHMRLKQELRQAGLHTWLNNSRKEAKSMRANVLYNDLMIRSSLPMCKAPHLVL